MSHKVDTSEPPDPDEAIKLSPADRREGSWTKLDLLGMDQRFCEAMERAHPEMVALERRRRAAWADPRSLLEGGRPLARGLACELALAGR